MHSDTNNQQEAKNWADLNIDEEIGDFLLCKENGKKLKLDHLAHMEYFYNTRVCDHQTENPFLSPNKYLALNYVPSDCNSCSSEKPTLLQRHRAVIHPKLTSSSASKSFSPSKVSMQLATAQQAQSNESSAVADPMVSFHFGHRNYKIGQ